MTGMAMLLRSGAWTCRRAVGASRLTSHRLLAMRNGGIHSNLSRTRMNVRAYNQSASSGGSGHAAAQAAEAEVLWPIAGGATVIGGILLGSFWLRNDSAIIRTHGWLQHVTKSGMTADSVSMPWLLRVAFAFGVSQLPVDTLRVRQLGQGALHTWGAMLGSYDYEQQQLALGALCPINLPINLPQGLPALPARGLLVSLVSAFALLENGDDSHAVLSPPNSCSASVLRLLLAHSRRSRSRVVLSARERRGALQLPAGDRLVRCLSLIHI